MERSRRRVLRSCSGTLASPRIKQSHFCPPPGLPRWLTGFCTTHVMLQLETGSSAKDCVHWGKPSGGIHLAVRNSVHEEWLKHKE